MLVENVFKFTSKLLFIFCVSQENIMTSPISRIFVFYILTGSGIVNFGRKPMLGQETYSL